MVCFCPCHHLIATCLSNISSHTRGISCIDSNGFLISPNASVDHGWDEAASATHGSEGTFDPNSFLFLSPLSYHDFDDPDHGMPELLSGRMVTMPLCWIRLTPLLVLPRMASRHRRWWRWYRPPRHWVKGSHVYLHRRGFCNYRPRNSHHRGKQWWKRWKLSAEKTALVPIRPPQSSIGHSRRRFKSGQLPSMTRVDICTRVAT